MIIDPKDQKKPLLHYFLKGEFLKRIFDNTATAVGLVNSFFIIHTLSVFQFGLYQLVLAFVNLLDNFNLEFIDSVVTVDVRRYLNVGKLAAAKRLFLDNAYLKMPLAVLSALAVFAGARVISGFYGADIALFIQISGLLLITGAIQAVETIFLKSILSYSFWSFPAVREISKLAIIVGFLMFGHLTILQVIIAHVSAEAASVLVVGIYALVKYFQSFGKVIAQKEHLIGGLFRGYGKWATIRFLAAKVSKSTAPFFIKFFINTEAVGFYSLAVNLITFVQNIMPLDGLAPIMGLKADNKDQLGFIFQRAVKYTFWLGGILTIFGWIAVPPVLVFLFPKYLPAIPLFRIMLLAMPIYGFYKILKNTLTVLREYRILTMRIINETLMTPLSSVVFLPLFGILGAGVVYVVVYLERVWFFYSRLFRAYPELRIKFRSFIKFDKVDRELTRKLISRVMFWRSAPPNVPNL